MVQAQAATQAVEAGGGLPSVVASQQYINEFATPVLQHLVEIYKHLSSKPHGDAPHLATEAAFLSHIGSPESSLLDLSSAKEDLSWPLSSYYISSSHNTYLSGHQLYGEASTEAYTNVLERGCRCLEIDVWDGEHPSNSSSDADDVDIQVKDKIRKEHRGTRDRSDSKPSRWDRLKAKAAGVRNRSRSRSTSAHRSGLSAGGTSETMGSTSVPGQVNLSTDQPIEHSEEIEHLLRAEPRVLHGYTFTKDVPFRAVCHAIRASAFTATDLPLIVSLEVHAGLAQQEIMVEIMKEVWKDNLLDITQMAKETEIQVLPSPDELRRKILIKVKWTPNTDTGESNDPSDLVESNDVDDEGVGTTPEKKKKAAKILAELSQLGVYTRAYTFKQFSQPEATMPTHVFSLSESKIKSIHKTAQGHALFAHNRNYMMRAFPSGMRVNSSNVEPTFLWRQGAQMVAMNWQKLDRGMMLNEGMFSGGEGWVLKPEGYRSTVTSKGKTNLDKPATEASATNSAPTGIQNLTAQLSQLDIQKQYADIRKKMLDLKIQVFAGQNISAPHERDALYGPKLKPYCQFQLHIDLKGLPGQEAADGSDRPASRGNTSSRFSGFRRSKEQEGEEGGMSSSDEEDPDTYKRRSSTARTSNPDFYGEILEWAGIPDVVEELTFLRLKVKDDRSLGKDDLAAWACIRLDRLQTGYRFIHLLDSKGFASEGAILVHVSKTVQ